MSEVNVIGRAKVNLFLRVGTLRSDGFHEVESVMQSIDWFDEISLERASASEVEISWHAGHEGEIPQEPDIVARALAIVNENVGGTQAARIWVSKRIPVGAGLGGGSADAAAAILGMNELMGRVMPARLMMEIARQVASDVPFALQGGTALATGRGEKVSAEPCPSDLWWVIGIPAFALATRSTYEKFDEVGRVNARDSAPLLDALKLGDVEEAAKHLHNDLEEAAFSVQPTLRDYKARLSEAGVLGAVMTGSGSALAGLCIDESHASAVAKAVEDVFSRVEIARSARRGAEIVR